MLNHFGDEIVFHKQPNPSKPELLYSSRLSVQGIINAAAESSKSEHYQSCSTKDAEKASSYKMKVLFPGSPDSKSRRQREQSIRVQPLSVDDISLERGRQVIPDSLYNFLCWFTSHYNKNSI